MLTPLVYCWQTPGVPSVGEQLREAIRAAKLDYAAVAAQVGVHEKTVAKWANGTYDGPRDPEVRARLAAVLGVDVYERTSTPFRHIEDVPDQEFVAELARRLGAKREAGATGQFVVTDAAALRSDDPGPDEIPGHGAQA